MKKSKKKTKKTIIDETKKTVNQLKKMGYAVVFFSKNELDGADADAVENAFIEFADDVINKVKEESESLPMEED